MSSYRALEDSILNILTSIQAERDPIQRLAMTEAISKTTHKALSEIRQEAAYKARLTYPTVQVSEMTGINRKALEYLVRVYLVNNPHIEPPKYRKRVEIGGVVDLSGDSPSH